jgi:hypothetical protein
MTAYIEITVPKTVEEFRSPHASAKRRVGGDLAVTAGSHDQTEAR